MVDGDLTRLMIFAPPQHGKSEIVSRRFPAYILGRNPDANIIACSYTDALAGPMNRDVQRIIDSEEYAELFPDTRLWGTNVRSTSRGLYLRNSDVFEIVGRRGRYRSAGVGSGITGMGADYAIIDDPIKDDREAYSPIERQALLDWYRGTFYTRLRRGARVLLTMTRWHKNDLAGVLLEESRRNPDADQWVVLRFPAIKDDAPNDYDPRQPGEPLWPEFKDTQALREIQATLGPTRWNAMYQQAPRAEEGAEWPEEYFTDIWFSAWPKTRYTVVACDPSKGKGDKWGDYFAIVVAGVAGHEVYVDAVLRNDKPIDAMIETAIMLYRQYRADAIGVESTHFQELLGGEIIRCAEQHGVLLSPILIDNREKKELRIRRLSPWLANHQLRFRSDSIGARLLVEQLRAFPNGEHDDGPDALEMALRILAEIGCDYNDGLGDRLLLSL